MAAEHQRPETAAPAYWRSLDELAGSESFREAVVDPVIHALVTLTGGRRRRVAAALRAERDAAAEALLQEPPARANNAACLRVLSDTDTLARMHLRAWTSKATHPDWLRLS